MKKSKINLLIGLALFVFTFGIYISALCPTIYTRDNPDLVTASITLGIPHPPGYPLYTILGNIFSKLPIGSLPFRVNLMSALFSAFTIFIIYLIIFKLTKKILPALLGASILAFSYNYFLQSLSADFLSLNNLLVSLEILLILIWRETKSFKILYLFAFIVGLAFSHHQISFLVVPAFLYLIFVTDRKVLLNWKIALKLIGFFVLGLLPYLYLPIRASMSPQYQMWGEPNTFKGFFEMISRKEYTGDDFLYINLAFIRIWDWFKWISLKEFVLIGFILGLWGLYKLKSQNYSIYMFLLILILLSGPGFAFLANVQNTWNEMASMQRFFIFSFMIFSILIGIGINFIANKYKKASNIIIILPLFLLIYFYPQVNLKKYYYSYNLGENIFKSLPENSVLFAGSDVPLFQLWYLQIVEKQRPDIIILPAGDPIAGDIPKTMENKIIKSFPDYQLSVEELSKKYQIYSASRSDLFWQEKIRNLVPEGLVYRFSENTDWKKSFSPDRALNNFNQYNYQGNYSITKKTANFTREILKLYSTGWFDLGITLHQGNDLEAAADAYKKSLSIDPGNIAAQTNYAGTFLERGQYEEAAELYNKILEEFPYSVAAQNGLIKARQKMIE